MKYPDSEMIKMLIEQLGESQTSFSKKLKIPQSTLAMAIKRDGISYKLLKSIMETYPQINPNWLLTGEGDMFRVGSDVRRDQKKSVCDITLSDNFNSEIARLEAIIKSKDEIIEALNQTIESQKESLKLFKVMVDKILSMKNRIKKE